jgi:hypothetical protein
MFVNTEVLKSHFFNKQNEGHACCQFNSDDSTNGKKAEESTEWNDTTRYGNWA